MGNNVLGTKIKNGKLGKNNPWVSSTNLGADVYGHYGSKTTSTNTQNHESPLQFIVQHKNEFLGMEKMRK